MDKASTDLRVPDQRSSDPAGSLIDDIIDSVVSVEDLSIRTAMRVRRMDAELFELCATTTALMESVDHRALYGLTR